MIVEMMPVWAAMLIAVLALVGGCIYGSSVKLILMKEREAKKRLIQEAIDEYVKRCEKA
jgi:hypothetical protein